jgi:hypothetical protein
LRFACWRAALTFSFTRDDHVEASGTKAPSANAVGLPVPADRPEQGVLFVAGYVCDDAVRRPGWSGGRKCSMAVRSRPAVVVYEGGESAGRARPRTAVGNLNVVAPCTSADFTFTGIAGFTQFIAF